MKATVRAIQIGLFNIVYDGVSVVTICSRALDEVAFVNLLDEAQKVRSLFTRALSGSDWGCDGVGYEIQKKRLRVEIHRSGVSPRQFERGIGRLEARLPSRTGTYDV